MNERQRRHLEDLRQRYEQRLHALEKKAAILGYSTPAEIVTEIEDIQAKIDDLDSQLARRTIRPDLSLSVFHLEKKRWQWIIIGGAAVFFVGLVLWWRNHATSPTASLLQSLSTPSIATLAPALQLSTSTTNTTTSATPTLTASPPTPTTIPLLTSTTFQVFANLSWQSTEIHVKDGDNIKITYVSGLWKTSLNATPTDPLGSKPGEDITPPGCSYPMLPHVAGLHALIAKIGDNGEPFNPFKSTMQGEGMLYLRANDCDKYLEDNSGSVTVRIEIAH